jgi:predicted DNA-binding transcriptional regulator AlpA
MSELKETLQRIESLLLSQKEVFNLKDFCQYSGLSESAAYKLTHLRKIPHSRPGGKLIFLKKNDIDNYLLSNPVSLTDDIEQESINFLSTRSIKGGKNGN